MDAPARRRVLIVDDEASQRSAVSGMIERWGYEVAVACDGEEALIKLRDFQPHAMTLDLLMPRMDGMEVLRQMRAQATDSPAVIVISAYGNLDTAVSAVHEFGAFWFLEKPVKPRAFRVLLEKAVSQRQLLDSKTALEQQLARHGVLGRLVGQSTAMQELFFTIRQVAPTRATVLITGPSGSGKEMVARAIHEGSPRSAGSFVAINCAALPETLIESELFGHEKGAFTGALTLRQGCFELADRGTLLLDEIGEMPLPLQAKLLRVLEEGSIRRLGAATERKVDVRVLAATNRDLTAMVKAGTFREDLYYRLCVLQLAIPSLAERIDDLPLLATAMISDLNRKHETRVTGIQPDVLEALSRHSWPGNVRELRNIIERAVVLAGEGEIKIDHLPPGFAGLPLERARQSLSPVPGVLMPVGTTLDQSERMLIELTLSHTKNNRTRAAEILGVTAKTLYNKLKEYGDAVE